jgi:methylmalonyl-CoA mutase cobalamin-binding domain/chain
VRFVTAASLFDGHDAAINVMRRLLQSQGAEVVHLGHDRSVDTVVRAAVEEDVQGAAISSYPGGHVEYFSYLVERLAEAGAGHVQVFGGGGAASSAAPRFPGASAPGTPRSRSGGSGDRPAGSGDPAPQRSVRFGPYGFGPYRSANRP